MRRCLLMSWAASLVLLASAAALAADKPAAGEREKQETPAANGAAARPPHDTAGFTPEREAAALTFVRMHHAELADLLVPLKQADPTEYQRAIRELFRTSERLALLKERQPRRHELDLRAWKLNSRLQLLVARITMAPSKDLEDELRRLLDEQIAVRQEQWLIERERLLLRVREIDEQIAQGQAERTDEVERQLERILKRAGIVAKSSKTAPGPNKAEKKPAAQ